MDTQNECVPQGIKTLLQSHESEGLKLKPYVLLALLRLDLELRGRRVYLDSGCFPCMVGVVMLQGGAAGWAGFRCSGAPRMAVGANVMPDTGSILRRLGKGLYLLRLSGLQVQVGRIGGRPGCGTWCRCGRVVKCLVVLQFSTAGGTGPCGISTIVPVGAYVMTYSASFRSWRCLGHGCGFGHVGCWRGSRCCFHGGRVTRRIVRPVAGAAC